MDVTNCMISVLMIRLWGNSRTPWRYRGSVWSRMP